MFRHVIFDLDQTLADTERLEEARKARNWNLVYRLIPQARLYDGIGHVLDIIRQNDITVALVTTTPRAYVEKVAAFFNIPYSHIVSYHDAPPKPSPAPMLKALELMNADAREAISFGDRATDIRSSNDAGIESVACFWGTREPDLLWRSGYRHAVRKPEEILTLIR